jgi:hypothetical protein
MMTFAERVLYHQIHPAKVFADVASALLAIDLFWRHELLPGIVIALLPPALVSAVLLREADLERYRASGMGAYLRRFMPPWVQALRLFGAAVAWYAAWYRVPALVIGGLVLVAACWANGIGRRGRSPHDIAHGRPELPRRRMRDFRHDLRPHLGPRFSAREDR